MLGFLSCFCFVESWLWLHNPEEITATTKINFKHFKKQFAKATTSNCFTFFAKSRNCRPACLPNTASSHAKFLTASNQMIKSSWIGGSTQTNNKGGALWKQLARWMIRHRSFVCSYLAYELIICARVKSSARFPKSLLRVLFFFV